MKSALCTGDLTMALREILQLCFGLLVTLGLVALAFSFPNYKVYTENGVGEHVIVRRARWNAPDLFAGRDSSEHSSQATTKKNIQPNESVGKTSDLSTKAHPIYFHNIRYGGDENLLSLFVQVWLALYIAFAIYKVINRG